MPSIQNISHLIFQPVIHFDRLLMEGMDAKPVPFRNVKTLRFDTRWPNWPYALNIIG